LCGKKANKSKNTCFKSIIYIVFTFSSSMA